MVAVTIPCDIDDLGIDGHCVEFWWREMVTSVRKEVCSGRIDVTKSLHSLGSGLDTLEKTGPLHGSVVRAGLVTWLYGVTSAVAAEHG